MRTRLKPATAPRRRGLPRWAKILLWSLLADGIISLIALAWLFRTIL